MLIILQLKKRAHRALGWWNFNRKDQNSFAAKETAGKKMAAGQVQKLSEPLIVKLKESVACIVQGYLTYQWGICGVLWTVYAKNMHLVV